MFNQKRFEQIKEKFVDVSFDEYETVDEFNEYMKLYDNRIIFLEVK